jgi:hypothetical protein
MMQDAEKQGVAVVTAVVDTATAPAAADESEQPVIDGDRPSGRR